MSIDITKLFFPNHLRRTHLLQGIDLIVDNDEDDYTAVDLTTEKTAAISACDAAVDATSLPAEDKATLKTAIAAAINTHIANTYPVLISDVLAELIARLDNAFYTYEVGDPPTLKFQYHHTRCKGVGQYPASQDAGESPDNETNRLCSCDGIGKTTTPDNGLTTWTYKMVW